ncbi:hypothetical protein A3J43_01140 [Candidatus Uhrbacteria bacterium RIFCSPHIGHO2_12_FULL_54_23]|uniref:YbaK/aminoacyl-tRNA synthetase-associated domain-containing protein n=3 Tax=Candidatus Uhriibacteriota TaxID=1752732 RepID=A0A1F7UM34_9BACT|nr:MAG: hypothetical protein A3J43_01140 [Candidatus Uhrbacteria bacterium RIFCSPHIGHO2_12_FULL_54_23]OGL84569.1 MAG: hypothetical protein A3B36_01155 [Candidatus Uhrbacteria bacterium RIFCSPLOWO2_01_FULL_55_36]OGL90987.1 MAG: hypothetical protein A3J36_00190 [Candidatus Uhrbacteria bacterium RIFCSPLOWO2_02_FULL_54_37]
MSIPKKLLNYLQQKKAEYEFVPHKTVFTAFDLAQTLHRKSKEVVKTLVVKLNGKEPVVVMLTADKNLDKKKFLNVVNAWMMHKKAPPEALELKEKIRGRARTLEFANEKWLREKVMGKPGATPSFGSLLKMPLFVDKQVLTLKTLLINSGGYETSIKMSVAEFKKLERCVEGRFSALRK